LLAKTSRVAEFIRAVDELRDDVERLEKRLQRLVKDGRLGTPPSNASADSS
jgi:ubiquinone biosynthesis protein UbiJ